MQTMQRIDPKARQYLLVMYALNGLGFCTLISPVVAVIVAYIQKSKWEDSIYRDHVQYIIRTFWASLAAGVMGTFLVPILGLGVLVLSLLPVWFAYRSAFGAWRIWQYHGVNPQKWIELP